MKKILLSMSLILAIMATGVAQQKPPAKGAAAAPAATATPPQNPVPAQVLDNFVIGLEDALGIIVWKEADHSAQVIVRPDGMITLPLVGEIKAAGLTPKQLEAIIIERLMVELLQDPRVTVTVLKIESQKVTIVGAVGKPGAYPLGSPMTVLDLIARAGGLSDLAKTTKIKVIRKKDGQVLPFNYKDVMNGKNLKQNIFLENGDTVLVPG